MAGYLTLDGERDILEMVALGWPAVTLRLAKTAFPPAKSMAPGDFAEATFDGYAPIILPFVGLQPGTPGDKAVADFSSSIFTCTGSSAPQDIYGYWVQTAGGRVWYVNRFSGTPRPMRLPGQTITVPWQLRFWCPILPP